MSLFVSSIFDHNFDRCSTPMTRWISVGKPQTGILKGITDCCRRSCELIHPVFSVKQEPAEGPNSACRNSGKTKYANAKSRF